MRQSTEISTGARRAVLRAELRALLDSHRPEIEAAVLNRICAIADPSEVSDPSYAHSLHTTVSAALDYALVSIERGERNSPPPPPALLAQARMAARCGVGLDTVLRRYLAGYALLGEFVNRKIELLAGVGSASDLLSGRAAVLDRIIASISEEYERESRLRPESIEQQRAERVEQLLAGEPIDPSDLAYDFDSRHVGLAARGPSAASALRDLAISVDNRLLYVTRPGEVVWGWLEARRKLTPGELQKQVLGRLPGKVSIAIGEPACGLAGWRLTHRQAVVALQVALRRDAPVVRYADVALLASALRDGLLAESLRRLYLEPLEGERDGGVALRRTLRAYLAANGRISGAAAKLNVDRRTVSNRLARAEERIDRPLGSVHAELETALRLEELAPPTHHLLNLG